MISYTDIGRNLTLKAWIGIKSSQLKTAPEKGRPDSPQKLALECSSRSPFDDFKFDRHDETRSEQVHI
jgi:hypothetical protein